MILGVAWWRSYGFGGVSGGPSAKQAWNINIHYDALLESKVPLGAERVLDVGCGDGFLAARLAQRVSDVTAFDVDAPVLQRAQARPPRRSGGYAATS